LPLLLPLPLPFWLSSFREAGGSATVFAVAVACSSLVILERSGGIKSREMLVNTPQPQKNALHPHNNKKQKHLSDKNRFRKVGGLVPHIQ